jgi:hypothetical protein
MVCLDTAVGRSKKENDHNKSRGGNRLLVREGDNEAAGIRVVALSTVSWKI